MHIFLVTGRNPIYRILCFGDSNTWGSNPQNGDRFARDERWPGVLRNILGEGYEIIEEGLGGRTTVWDDPIEGYKNGKEYLIPCLDTHRPLDLVIILLGTNDLKKRFSLSAQDIAFGAAVLARIVMKSEAGINGRPPLLLLMAPPSVAAMADFSEMFEGAVSKSRLFARHYAAIAAELGCGFLDTGAVVVSSKLDGIHLDAGEHKKLGSAVAAQVKTMIGESG